MERKNREAIDKEIAEALESKYLEARALGRPISQKEIAKEMGVGPARVSHVRTGRRSIFGLSPKRRWLLLRGFGFSEEELVELNERYDLEIDAYLLALLNAPQVEEMHMKKVKYLGNVTQGLSVLVGLGDDQEPSAPTERLSDTITGNYKEADLFMLNVDKDTFATKAVKDYVKVGTKLIFHSRLYPGEGDIVCVWLGYCEIDEGVLQEYNPDLQTIKYVSYGRKAPIGISRDCFPEVKGVLVGLYRHFERDTPRPLAKLVTLKEIHLIEEDLPKSLKQAGASDE